MLSLEENEELTRVGPGTPGGELLRRYWHPICPASELSTDRPIRRVRLLGEDLVLFSDADGSYGLVREHCSHRSASLYYGYVEDGGIRCPYHGWLYDKTGRCLEQPFEPEQSMLKHAVRHPAYPVEKLGGLIFAYLGPDPAPLLPRWDVLAREDGERSIEIQGPVLNCNWLQCQENSLDSTHNYYTHALRMVVKGIRNSASLRASQGVRFEMIEWGIVKRNIYRGDGMEAYTELGHPAVFPNILRHSVERARMTDDDYGAMSIDMQWRVPIDDAHTQILVVDFTPTKDGRPGQQTGEPTVNYLMGKDENGEFHLNDFPSQDQMAWETQGAITNRSVERLGVSDRGIAMWRQLLKEQIEVVRSGDDPIGVVRDRAKNECIDLGPSRVKVGDRFVPKAWQGWETTDVWESPPLPTERLAGPRRTGWPVGASLRG